MDHIRSHILLVGVIGSSLVGSVAVGDEANVPTHLRIPLVGANESAADGECPESVVVRSRNTLIDVERLADLGRRGSGTIGFDLFEGVSFTGIIERVESRSRRSSTFVGSLMGEVDGRFVLVTDNDAALANIRIPSREAFYQIRYLGDGRHVAYEIDESAFPPCGTGPGQTAPAVGQSARHMKPRGACDDDGSVIDVLVVYTPLARLGEGGTAGINAVIDLAVAESNTAYDNSLIETQLNVVYRGLIDYDESGGYADHLYRLTDPDDGYMDEVHQLRDAHRADLVVLLVNDWQYCGIAWLIDNLPEENDDFGFSVVTHQCATGVYAFAHELGHNMGCAHDRDNASGPGLYDYSYGFQDTLEEFRTVMAYDCCPSHCPRIDQFSNPDVLAPDIGRPTGVPVGDPDAAHNALTINNTATIIANFRKALDCNDNGICDNEDISGGTSTDCNLNGTPDECESDDDCNENGVPDSCDIGQGVSPDCNSNGVPDECMALELDCNRNGVPDACDISDQTSRDCNGNGVPDDCEGDCNNNGLSDFCDALEGVSPDANTNGYPDECEPPILLVDADAAGLDNGQSWADAFMDLQSALTVALIDRSFVEEIWVAAGTYRPSTEREPGCPQSATFELVSGMGLYGGFAADETSRLDRDPTVHVTVLSGDLDGNDEPGFLNNEENAWHVVTAIGTNFQTVLDGFTITAGNANLDQLLWLYEADGGYYTGGGMYISDGNPMIANVTFAGNTASVTMASGGGGLCIAEEGNPTLINCTFIGNRATALGGGALNVLGSSNATLLNCSFIENQTFG